MSQAPQIYMFFLIFIFIHIECIGSPAVIVILTCEYVWLFTFLSRVILIDAEIKFVVHFS